MCLEVSTQVLLRFTMFEVGLTYLSRNIAVKGKYSGPPKHSRRCNGLSNLWKRLSGRHAA